VMVNGLGLVAVPSPVVTVTGPDGASAGTLVVIVVAFFTLNVAVTPLNLTVVAPVKPLPLIVTGVPTAPLPGVNVVIDGLDNACAGLATEMERRIAATSTNRARHEPDTTTPPPEARHT